MKMFHDDGDSSASPCQQDDPPAPDLQDDPPALAAHQPQGAPNVPPQPPPTEADLRNRGGRPPLAREFANPALGILLLDMRDKFPSMTELCQDDQFCLQNATHNLGVDAAISGRYARRCAQRDAEGFYTGFKLCPAQCSLQYGIRQGLAECPVCSREYRLGGSVFLFDVNIKFSDLLRSHAYPEVTTPRTTRTTKSFLDSPRCAEVLSAMPAGYKVLVSGSFDGAVPWKRATKVDL